jgi:hypothetical protein
MPHLVGFGRRIGRRGAALLFFAFLDFVFAWSLIAPAKGVPRSGSMAYAAHIMPLPAWAALWALVGVVCLVQAFRAHDRAAFALAMGIKTLWGCTMLLGWLVAGLPRGYVSAAVWLAMAGWVFVISTWPEPPPLLKPVPLPEPKSDGGI